MSYRGIEVVQIVATDLDCCIGKNNALPWHIPEDLKHFKKITEGGIVVMGRKTYQSIGKPLPDRSNWVLSNYFLDIPGIQVAHSITEILSKATEEALEKGKNCIFVIGGGQVYRDTLFCTDTIFMTQIQVRVAGDTYYFDPSMRFKTTSIGDQQTSENGSRYRHLIYRKLQ